MECRVKKISKRCGCAPWFIPRDKNKAMKMNADYSIDSLPVCQSQGIKCFEEQSKSYNEDLIDRTECDCKNDCEMVHTFSTLQVNDSILYRKANYVNLCFTSANNVSLIHKIDLPWFGLFLNTKLGLDFHFLKGTSNLWRGVRE